MNDDRRAEKGFQKSFKKLHKRTKMTIIDLNSFSELVKKSFPADDALLMWACSVHLNGVNTSEINNFDKHDLELREMLNYIRSKLQGTAPPSQVVLWIFCHTNDNAIRIGKICDEIMGIARGRADQGPLSYWASPCVKTPNCITRYVQRIRASHISEFTPGNPSNDTEMTGLSTIRVVSLWSLISKVYPVTPTAVYDMVCRLVEAEEDREEHAVQCIESVVKVAERFGINPGDIDPFPSQRIRDQYEREWSSSVLSHDFRLPQEVENHSLFAQRRILVREFKRLVIEWGEPNVTYLQVLDLIEELCAWQAVQPFRRSDGHLSAKSYAELICGSVREHNKFEIPELRGKGKRMSTFICEYAFTANDIPILISHSTSVIDDKWMQTCRIRLANYLRLDAGGWGRDVVIVPDEIVKVVDRKCTQMRRRERERQERERRERERQERERRERERLLREQQSLQVPASPTRDHPQQSWSATPTPPIDVVGQKKPRSFDIEE